jgi:hypothetical protein
MRVKMHYTAHDEQMYLFLYVEECPRHVRHSSAWASLATALGFRASN